MDQSSNITVSSNFQLPIDLIFDILSRVPVKSLLQFKSVCKTWYALIESPNFIKKQHKRLEKNLSHTLTSLFVIDYDYLTNSGSMWVQSRDSINTSNPNPSFLLESFPRILGICDGLVCISFDDSKTIICNPTIGWFRKISDFNLPGIKSNDVISGFGFHENEYKLFRIVPSTPPSEVFFRVEFYSMSTNIWREIEVNTRDIDNRVSINGYHHDSIPVAINEIFYWKGYCDVKSVVSFNMNGNVFGVIACPEEITRGYRVYWKIIDFKGEVAVTTCHGCFDMWVLNEKEKSWNMKLRVDGLPSMGVSLSAFGCERNGNPVLRHMSRNLEMKVFSYDLKSCKSMYFTFGGLMQRHIVYLYTESLLSV